MSVLRSVNQHHDTAYIEQLRVASSPLGANSGLGDLLRTRFPKPRPARPGRPNPAVYGRSPYNL
jgi:hypothetical protein